MLARQAGKGSFEGKSDGLALKKMRKMQKLHVEERRVSILQRENSGSPSAEILT
jgi:hypothetical protein